MAQNYLWKVVYEEYEEVKEPCDDPDFPKGCYYTTGEYHWACKSKVFSNKIEAMRFINKIDNRCNYRNVRMKKWFG